MPRTLNGPATPGRNDPCPCGSGRKFKKCHAAPTSGAPRAHSPGPPPGAVLALARAEAAERRRLLLQGLGRPILTAELGDQRAVVVGNDLIFFRDCRTFPDFLFAYLRSLIGRSWWLTEAKTAPENWHPLMKWHEAVAQQQQRHADGPPGTIFSAPLTIAMRLVLQLAYDLYTLAHNIFVRDSLLDRLRDADQFPGARYEAHVAASLVRSGFSIDFEDESDRSRSHCEFAATHPPTGRTYSVEAKHRTRPPVPGARTGHRLIGTRLAKAFKKNALHERLIFIDVAVERVAEGVLPHEYQQVLGYCRSYERQNPGKKAYVIITNALDANDLESISVPWVGMQDSIGIPDARLNSRFDSLGDALRSRTRHQPILDLIAAMQRHYEIPSTFDGQLPEFAFNHTKPRLLIGERYNVPLEDGTLVPGVLCDAIVLEPERTAYGIYELADGRRIRCATPLSEAELRAYRRQPETFFDVVQHVGSVGAPDDVLATYDFLFATYSKATKDALLSFMQSAPDYSHLRQLDQPTLAHLYCERMAEQMVRLHRRCPRAS